MDNVLWIAIGFVIVMAVAGAVAGLLGRGSAPTRSNLPYEKQAYFFSRAERSFYEVLRRACGSELQVFAKVGLKDLVRVRKGTEGRQAHQNRIQQKHVDFVLCTVDTLLPVLVVELDDASHGSEKSQARDGDKDAILEAAGLQVLRVPARASYNERELAEAIRSLSTPTLP